MIGVLNIYKPRGVSSSFVVVKLKKLLNTKKVGHMGTLDPLAEGVLPICVGRATKLFDYFLKKQKTYVATFQFGYQTSTLDLEGEIEQKSLNIPTYEQLQLAAKKMIGKSFQMPPKYSSKKISGQKACDLVRSGKDIELKPCEIEIFDFKILNQILQDTFEFEITCSAGTYIRSIARDLAQNVGSLATMTKLVRTKSGPFLINNSINFEKLEQTNLEKELISLEEVLIDFDPLFITETQLKTLLDGKKLLVEEIVKTNKKNAQIKHSSNKTNEQVFYKVVCNNSVVAIAFINDGAIKAKTYFI